MLLHFPYDYEHIFFISPHVSDEALAKPSNPYNLLKALPTIFFYHILDQTAFDDAKASIKTNKMNLIVLDDFAKVLCSKENNWLPDRLANLRHDDDEHAHFW